LIDQLASFDDRLRVGTKKAGVISFQSAYGKRVVYAPDSQLVIAAIVAVIPERKD
jgi:hypothetical protein